MNKRHIIIPLFVPHEGCPHNCVFCNQNSITGYQNEVTSQTVHSTVKEYFNTINRDESIVEISFFGGTFTAIPADKQIELLTAAKYYKDSGLIDYIRLSTRPDYINEEILQRLKLFSVDIIELGLQSMDNEVLRLSGRGHSKADTINASIKIKEYGFTLGHQIMLGLPGDNIEKDIVTAYESIKLNPDLCRIYPALVLKDTPMEIMYKKGEYKPYTLEEAVEISKIIYCLYTFYGINVIRVGLQATDNITEGKDIVHGPYHPAFRELVEGSLLCDMIFNEVKDIQEPIEIIINPKYLSRLYANKKIYFSDMKRQLSSDEIRVSTKNSLEKGYIEIKTEKLCRNMSIFDYISQKVKEGKTYII